MVSIAQWILTGTFVTVGIVAANWYDIQRMIQQRSHKSRRSPKHQQPDVRAYAPEKS